MAKFSLYNIPLKSLSSGKNVFEYELDKNYFEAIDGDEVKKGNVKATVVVKKISSGYELNFTLKGVVQVPCDRCLEDMNQEIDYHDRLMVKLGEEYSEESDEIVIIPEEDGEINVSWFLYEFIVLNIPIKHVHESGECNKTMSSKLRKHRAVNIDEEDNDLEDNMGFEDSDDTANENIDPRWEGLKGISFDEN